MYSVAITISVLLVSLFSLLCAQTDLTLVEGANGREVVFATVFRIQQSGVFPDDSRFLRRLAFVESRDGQDSSTFRNGYYGGIWQVDEAIFQMTLNVTAHPKVVLSDGIYAGIRKSFNLNWLAVSWRDLRRPLFSALAARIFFEIAVGNIPDIGDVRGQGRYWKDTGFNSNNSDTAEYFTEMVNILESKGELINKGKITKKREVGMQFKSSATRK